MKRNLIIILALLTLSTPAHAGFLFGYMLGHSTSGGRGSGASPGADVDYLGIPFFCLQYPKYEEYAKCRSASAGKIEWVCAREKAEDCWDDMMMLDDFMKREWAALQKLKRQE